MQISKFAFYYNLKIYLTVVLSTFSPRFIILNVLETWILNLGILTILPNVGNTINISTQFYINETHLYDSLMDKRESIELEKYNNHIVDCCINMTKS